MKRVVLGVCAVALLLIGCSGESPVASEPAAKLTVSGTVAATCELPPCNPGFGGSGGNVVPATPTPDPEPEEPASEATFELPNGATMEFVWIEPGTFTMGSPSSEIGRFDAEGPQHEVTITKGYWLGKYEITQGQWEAVTGTAPWSGSSWVQIEPQYPAVNISRDDVQGLISQLNTHEGETVYRLPTEAEWEYACRAGTTTRWSFGDDEAQLADYEWYEANTWDAGLRHAEPVGTKLPNPWGLHDMHGNVIEWVHDWYRFESGAVKTYPTAAQVDPQGPASGTHGVGRGGMFRSPVVQTRSAFRAWTPPDEASVARGARIVRSALP